jgi:hypothetical protein
MATNGSQNIATAVTGKILQGAGVGTAPTFSTATYPSTASSAGKILRADGTNIVATTATYPDTAGANLNLLVSDGTNWSSAVASAGINFLQCLTVQAGNPADSTTYYFSFLGTFTALTTINSARRFVVPFACTITRVYGVFTVAGTLGSNENCTLFLRKNDTSNTDISTTIQLTSSTVTVNNTGLSISLVAGDYVSWGFTGPAWGTNPTTVSFAGAFST